jgi:hypothetical protein
MLLPEHYLFGLSSCMLSQVLESRLQDYCLGFPDPPSQNMVVALPV